MKKILESRIVLVIVTIILSTTVSVIADNVITSNSVSYSNSKTSETTVNGALDELFESVKINEELVVIKDRLNQIESSYLTVNETYPIGSVYISTKNTNPETIFAGTTWTAFGTGRTLVGVNTSNTNFNTVEKTGGASSVTLTKDQLPSHSHTISYTHTTATITSSGARTHVMYAMAWGAMGNQITVIGGPTLNSTTLSDTIISSGAHSHTVPSLSTNTISTTSSGSVGLGSAVNIQNPYITVYMWKRTA